jgi:hypothetical protein
VVRLLEFRNQIIAKREEHPLLIGSGWLLSEIRRDPGELRKGELRRGDVSLNDLASGMTLSPLFNEARTKLAGDRCGFFGS